MKTSTKQKITTTIFSVLFIVVAYTITMIPVMKILFITFESLFGSELYSNVWYVLIFAITIALSACSVVIFYMFLYKKLATKSKYKQWLLYEKI